MLRIGRVPTSLTLLFWLLLTVCWVFKGQSADVMLADDCDAQVMTAGEEDEDTTAGEDDEDTTAGEDDEDTTAGEDDEDTTAGEDDDTTADDSGAEITPADDEEEEEEDTTAGDDDAEEIVADDDDSEVGRSLPTAAVKEAE